MTKTCSKCKRKLDITMFSRNCKAKDGLKQQCKDCDKLYKDMNKDKLREQERFYRENHREQIREYYHKTKTEDKIQRKREYYQEHKEYFKQYRESHKETRKDNKYNINIGYRICINTTTLFSSILKGRIKNSQTLLINCGYTVQQLKDYIKSQFTLEMNWDNYGSYWELDHVIPRNLFKYNSIDDLQFKICWSLKNLRPVACNVNKSRPRKLYLDVSKEQAIEILGQDLYDDIMAIENKEELYNE